MLGSFLVRLTRYAPAAHCIYFIAQRARRVSRSTFPAYLEGAASSHRVGSGASLALRNQVSYRERLIGVSSQHARMDGQ